MRNPFVGGISISIIYQRKIESANQSVRSKLIVPASSLYVIAIDGKEGYDKLILIKMTLNAQTW